MFWLWLVVVNMTWLTCISVPRAEKSLLLYRRHRLSVHSRADFQHIYVNCSIKSTITLEFLFTTHWIIYLPLATFIKLSLKIQRGFRNHIHQVFAILSTTSFEKYQELVGSLYIYCVEEQATKIKSNNYKTVQKFVYEVTQSSFIAVQWLVYEMSPSSFVALFLDIPFFEIQCLIGTQVKTVAARGLLILISFLLLHIQCR